MIRKKISLLIFFLVFLIFGSFLFSQKTIAFSQCFIDGGACTSPSICNANCTYCDYYEFRGQAVGYYMCGLGTNNGQVCCDSEGYPGFCNSQPYIQGTGPNACYYTGFNNTAPIDQYYGAPGGGTCESSTQPGSPSYASCPNCNTGGVCNSSTCNAQNTLGTNHCGYTSGNMQCHYTASTLEDGGPTYCNNVNYTAGCQIFWNNCTGAFSCINSTTCERTMGGRVTDADTGNGIAGVSVGGDVTDSSGYWTANNSTNNMSYGSAFNFAAPSGSTSNPCNNGYECGSGSPNPGSYSGTVGGSGDCGQNCNFTYTPGKISGHVWIDTDHSGTQNNGEVNAGSGILVQDTAGDYTYTDSSGNYLLNYLSTKSYTVYIHNFPGYKTITSPQTLSVPPNRVDINFGIAPAHSISGYVFTDWNYNNNFDAEDNSYIPPPAVNVVNTGGTIPVISDVPMTISNSSFETGGTPPSGWNFYVTAPAVGAVNQDCGTSSGGTGNTCSVHVNVSTANPGYFWYVNLLQPNLSLTQDTAYEATFYAKAGTSTPSHPIWVFLQQAAAPWVGYGWYNPTIPNDNTWRKYRFIFTSDYSDNATNLEFEFAQSTGDVWIDNVSIRPMSYTIPKLYDGTYSSTLSPMPPNTKQSPPVPNPVTVNGADVTYENLGVSPLYGIQGNVYIDANKSACYEPAYDPLYAGGGTQVSIQDPLPTGSGGTGTTTYSVTNGLYNSNVTLHAGTYSVTYAAPTPYLNFYPPVGFSVTVGHPGKSISCDTTLAQNVACW